MTVTDNPFEMSSPVADEVNPDSVNDESVSNDTDEDSDEVTGQSNPVPELQANESNKDNILVTSMWAGVTQGWEKLLEIQSTFTSTDRPDPAAVRNSLLEGNLQDGSKANKGTVNKAKELAKRLSDAVEEAKRVRSELTELAFSANGIESSSKEDDEQLKSEFKATRKAIVRMFDALSTYAVDRKDDVLGAFIKESLANLPGGKSGAIKATGAKASGTASSTVEPNGNVATSVVREWAREKGYSVGDKGRIQADIVEAYNAAHPA